MESIINGLVVLGQYGKELEIGLVVVFVSLFPLTYVLVKKGV